MKTNPNHQIHSFNHTEHSEGNFAGLTKREHMAIEFTKALLTGMNVGQVDKISMDIISNTATLMADKLIYDLNKQS